MRLASEAEEDYTERVSLGDDFGPEKDLRMRPDDWRRTLDEISGTIGEIPRSS